jgi:hypothetical protein
MVLFSAASAAAASVGATGFDSMNVPVRLRFGNDVSDF